MSTGNKRMNIVSHIENINELEKSCESGIGEVIVSTKGLGRFGNMDIPTIKELAVRCRKLPLRPVLEWDILMTETVFRESVEILKAIPLKDFKAVRVVDPGAVRYLMKYMPEVKIQLVLENGNNNLRAIEMWRDIVSNHIDRIVLPREIPFHQLKKNLLNLGVETELYVFGRLPITYSPRKLLDRMGVPTGQNNEKKALAGTNELPGEIFEVIENENGTFMFHSRDLCLLEHMDEISGIGVNWARIDPIPGMDKRKFCKGPFQENLTDRKFSKLKNELLDTDHASYIGDVIEVKNGSHIAIYVKNKSAFVKMNMKLRFLTPEGKIKIGPVCFLKNSSWNDVDLIESGSLAFMNHLSGISNKTAVFMMDA